MRTVKHTASFVIHQPAKELFPLFSAEGEKLWVPGWDYENIMGSTDLHEDYVFVTKSHDHASSEAVWIVKKYEPKDYLVEFYKVEPKEKIGIIQVQCAPLEASKTKVHVTYQYISLSASGEQFISNFTPVAYNAFIAEWETLLVQYFKTKHP